MSNSSTSSSNEEDLEEELEDLEADQEDKKKPAPIRRASETLKTDAKNKILSSKPVPV